MTDYSTYTIEELAADQYFCRWVLYPDAESEDFWNNWQLAHPDKQELLKTARQLVRSVGVKESEIAEERIAELWQNLQTQIEQAEVGAAKIRRLSSRSWYIGIAASILLLMGFVYFLLNPQETTYLVAKGEQHSYYLPDSSKVSLNADSRIIFVEGKWAEDRSVYLEGEGFFEVEKGSSFKVHTQHGQVEVLGTSFNVLTRETQFEVECLTGKVAVKTFQSTEAVQYLTAGKGTKLDEAGSLIENNFQLEDYKDWRRGEFYYENEKVTHVLTELARQFDKELIFQGSVDQRYSGSFTNEDMKDALYKVCWPLNLAYEIRQDTIIIKSN